MPLDSDLWFRRYHNGPDAEIGLVCFPHAGGAANFYLPMSTALSTTTQVLSVQYPGRQDRHTEPLIDDIHRLADEVFEAFRPLADRRWAFFGHSMGATVAFEVARRLDDAGIPPVMLFASGRRAPSSHREERVHLLDDRGVISELKALSGTDTRVFDNPELVELILPLVRSDYRAIETYRPRSSVPLSCPIVTLVGDTDPLATRQEAEAWEQHTTGKFELHTYSGGHFYINDHRPKVIEVVSSALAAHTNGDFNGNQRVDSH
ncbi:thioesterase II family protein [Saccharopolyspora phatthalungensis]|uniref:Surfactin synthase thioesterase subunit n=1 Tax=Saccharopolyspora phatthalungensis TaxID=664693 RepID=A0A840QIJ1_9PSEU|nr:alpha/beta fold hydrolase [Saccharopolyspora phatthalungensis]MBB5158698.1 surfactin synthase thioesterase subunit [Saccharopolyspora phatthalungensis]